MSLASRSSGIPYHAPAELTPRVTDLVRLGRNSDGGYLVPKHVLYEIEGCLSLGLGTEWSFEAALIKYRKGSVKSKDILFIDASISILGIIKFLIYMARRTFYEIRMRKPRTQWKYNRYDLRKAIVALVLYLPTFHLRKNSFRHIRKFVVSEAHGKEQIGFLEALSCGSDLAHTIVKMDIEGGEWDLLGGSEQVGLLREVPIFIVEFHDTRRRSFMDAVGLLKKHFWIAHIHGNTSGGCSEEGMPLYVEMTFVNNRFSPGTGIRKSLPIDGLDFPGRPGEVPYRFVFGDAT